MLIPVAFNGIHRIQHNTGLCSAGGRGPLPLFPVARLDISPESSLLTAAWRRCSAATASGQWAASCCAGFAAVFLFLLLIRAEAQLAG